ncbi:hypothetical protein CR161_09385 [Prosthecochloris sp. ZM]|uniref:hypothetical protein n=1 Tax=Prosthecochloris sp. ZM TaxID=2283143 RepID=UPI000DF833E0|nr:hypothetical protein [Prosthecochloris sp. ZM]RDD30894.1 hypothetical protein CR161_09385 [Prosthecochloris sp. ZM]
MPFIEDPASTFGTIADSIGIFGAIFATGAWFWAKQNNKREKMEQKRMNQKIPVILKSNESKLSLELPVHFRREELYRQEVMGRIGMIPMKIKGNRFSLSFTHTPDFLMAINTIQESDSTDPLVMPCTDEEIRQFDV